MIICIPIVVAIALCSPHDDLHEYGFSVDDLMPSGLEEFEESWETPYPFEIPKVEQKKNKSSPSKQKVITTTSGSHFDIELYDVLDFKDKMKDKKKKGKKPKK